VFFHHASKETLAHVVLDRDHAGDGPSAFRDDKGTTGVGDLVEE